MSEKCKKAKKQKLKILMFQLLSFKNNASPPASPQLQPPATPPSSAQRPAVPKGPGGRTPLRSPNRSLPSKAPASPTTKPRRVGGHTPLTSPSPTRPLPSEASSASPPIQATIPPMTYSRENPPIGTTGDAYTRSLHKLAVDLMETGGEAQFIESLSTMQETADQKGTVGMGISGFPSHRGQIGKPARKRGFPNFPAAVVDAHSCLTGIPWGYHASQPKITSSLSKDIKGFTNTCSSDQLLFCLVRNKEHADSMATFLTQAEAQEQADIIRNVCLVDKNSSFWKGVFNYRLFLANSFLLSPNPKDGVVDFFRDKTIEGSERRVLDKFFPGHQIVYNLTCANKKCPNAFARKEPRLYFAVGHQRALHLQLDLQTKLGQKQGRCTECLSDMVVSSIETQIGSNESPLPIIAIDAILDPKRNTHDVTAAFLDTVLFHLPSRIQLGNMSYGECYKLLGVSLSVGRQKDHFVTLTLKKDRLWLYDGTASPMMKEVKREKLLECVKERKAVPSMVFLGYQYLS